MQPMDARLEYMRDLRVWLRENGWHITQVCSARALPAHSTTRSRLGSRFPRHFRSSTSKTFASNAHTGRRQNPALPDLSVLVFSRVDSFQCQLRLHETHCCVVVGLVITLLCLRPPPARASPSPHPTLQETIVSTAGKGGNHAFLTLRADLAGGEFSDLKRDGGWQESEDWLGAFLPSRAMDLRGGRRPRDRKEAATFLAYLRHQRDWLRAIERARIASSAGESSGTPDAAVVSREVDRVVAAVEEANRRDSGGCAEQSDGGGEPLVTARRWRRSAGNAQGAARKG